jgi:hypothetical protein
VRTKSRKYCNFRSLGFSKKGRGGYDGLNISSKLRKYMKEPHLETSRYNRENIGCTLAIANEFKKVVIKHRIPKTER